MYGEKPLEEKLMKLNCDEIVVNVEVSDKWWTSAVKLKFITFALRQTVLQLLFFSFVFLIWTDWQEIFVSTFLDTLAKIFFGVLWTVILCVGDQYLFYMHVEFFGNCFTCFTAQSGFA